MLDRRRSTPFDRLGRWLLTLPPATRFGVAVAGLLLFLAMSSLLLVQVRAGLLGGPAVADPAAAKEARAAGLEPFNERVERVTDIAMRCFLECELSKRHFITDYALPKEFGRLHFDYRYWEVWVPEDFDFKRVLDLFREHVERKAQNVTINEKTLDAKTFLLTASVDGLDTHSFLFTKAAAEAPEGAKVLLAFVPDDKEKIDIDALPRVDYKGAPRVAIIIDDIGYRDAIDRLFLTLPGKVTFSVLPYGPGGRQLAQDAHDKGCDIMLHMPMEPISYPNDDPGQGKLLVTMPDADIRRSVEKNLEQIPHIVGVNNHMGSKFTADAAKMRVALEGVQQRGLFFVDSVTIGRSVAFRVAKEKGLRAAARNLFLDHSPDYESICRQVDLAGRIAKAQGSAIAIGHPFQNTFRALKDRMPEVMRQGVQFVPISDVVR